MGIILKEEVPFAHVVNSNFITAICAHCMKIAEQGLKRCSKCSLCYYCDPQCQKADWSSHKHECKLLNKHHFDSKPLITQLCRLLLRVIAKNRKSPPPAFNGRTLDMLVSNANELQERPTVQKTFTAIVIALKAVEDIEIIPSLKELFELYCKLGTNAVTITNDEDIGIGIGLYIGFSELNHSCDPDAYYLFEGPKMILRALKDGVTKYSSQLRISYCDLMEFNNVRRKSLKERYCFVCNCNICNDEERDRIARSLRCIYCKDGYCPMSLDGSVSCCSICKREVGLASNAAIDLLERVESLNKEYEKRVPENILLGCRIYEHGEKIFSKINIPMCKLANHIVRWAFNNGNYQLGAKYVEKTLSCFRYYFPAGYPVISERYFTAGKLHSLDDTTLALSARRLCQAITLLQISHGTEHRMVIEAADIHAKVRHQQREMLHSARH